ncbi:MAG TPA: TlpA disulfide reductase family protein [Pirellulales bacterium]|nr:TlpA disulfide reductase family protein [Pirellulales bacterium]
MSARFPRVLAVAFCAVACGTVFHLASAADEKKAKAGKESASQFDVPDGTPKELLAFIEKMKKLPAGGTTRKERMDHLRKVNQAIMTAAERVSEAKTDDATATAAIKAEFEALTMLKRLGEKDAEDKLQALSDKLKNDKRPGIAQMLKLLALQQKLEKLNASDTEAVESFLTEAKGIVTSSTPEPQLLPIAQATTVLLFRSGKQDEAAELGQKLADSFLESANPDMAEGAFQLANITGQIFEAQGRDKEAADLYRDFAERFSKSDNPALREAASQFEGSARKLSLVGEPMPITGKLVGGGQFDIAQYAGKVVLVDFWATWCGPCVAELPNVKDTYEKYHGRGFEVVGISLDNDADTLTKFIEEEKLPWPIIFEEGHPQAKQYGVTAIPMAVLINQDGKVVTLNARGEKLGELVAELLGVKASDEAGSKKEKKAG